MYHILSIIALLCFLVFTANAQDARSTRAIPRVEPQATPRLSPNNSGDPIPNALTDRFFTGQTAGDEFGYAVSSAGDVNADGYDDIIVSARFNDAGGSNAGRAYIYFGGFTVDHFADVILTGEAADDQFGTDVSTAGDVNGDGYDDVIVGARYNDVGGTSAGRAYIFFGGSTMNNAPDIIMTGEAANDNFGNSVSSAGDVNGDGYSDVIISASSHYNGGSLYGSAYVYYGGNPMDNTVDVKLIAQSSLGFFGTSASTAGDANGDGYADVIVGDGLGEHAYLFYGGATMDSIVDLTMTGDGTPEFFSGSVSTAGDVNGDGYSDLIVGAHQNDAGGFDAGRAYVFFGGATMDATADLIISGKAFLDHLGSSVSTAGDINGDGYDDIIIGAERNSAGGTDAGRAYIYYGSTTMNTIADVIMTGKSNSWFGKSVSTAGDVNGDGYDDVIVGAPTNNAGRAYLYLNSLTGSDIPDEFFTGAVAGDQLGFSVSNAGDVNGDGFDDLISGAPLYDHGANTNNGIAYIYFGGPLLDNIADVILTGDPTAGTGNQFGFSVSGAGDINGDGYDDIVVGAPYTDFGNTNRGTVSIFLGGNPMDGNRDFFIDGPAASNDETFGYSVSDAGDVNGDGFADIVVGGRGYNLNQGRAYVFYGGNPFNTVADVILSGQTINDFFGWSVSSAGDVNGDGFSDVIIGAPYYDIGGNSDVGRAYIYYGNITMDLSADVVLDGESAGLAGYFGLSVSTAGDVNGDGYSDVIVGAPYVFGSSGRAYVYFGGLFMDRIADVTLTPTEINSPLFGISVSTAGDINGDTYADVIVGETDSDAGGQNSGKAIIFFGSSSMDGLGDILMTGDAANIRLGISVSTAGDINGDGYADVVVGAHQSDAGGLDAGSTYLYLSSSPPIVPRIVSVQDIPSDQGGFATVRWIRSGYDARGIAKITDYVVQRSAPPGMGGFAWENTATLPATQDAQYSYTAAMPFDSSTSASGTFFFRVIARTANPLELWKSTPISGHSVDNLSPAPPANAQATPLGNSIARLNWDRNRTDPDVGVYRLYRSSVSGFPLADSTRVLATADTSIVDTPSVVGVTYYYRITTVDIHGNESAPSPQLTSAAMSSANIAMLGGWNMVSVPLSMLDYTKTILFPTAISDAFAYQGSYVVQSALENGDGYWLRFGAPEDVLLSGFVRDIDTIDVVSGWNMIGSISSPVDVTTITSIPGGIITSQFFGYNGAYVDAPTIEPGKGYWVRTTQAGQLILAAAPPEAGQIQIIPTQDMPPAPPVQTSVGDQDGLPTEFALKQNYPNPFNPSTTIGFDLPVQSQVRLRVYDVLGQEVVQLVDEHKSAGRFVVEWNGANSAGGRVTSGLYFYTMETQPATGGEGFVTTKKMLLLK